MAYEHEQQAQAVANSVLAVINSFLDEIPDKDQIAALIANISATFLTVASALSAETKKIYKLKFVIRVGIIVVNRLINQLLPDSES